MGNLPSMFCPTDSSSKDESLFLTIPSSDAVMLRNAVTPESHVLTRVTLHLLRRAFSSSSPLLGSCTTFEKLDRVLDGAATTHLGKWRGTAAPSSLPSQHTARRNEGVSSTRQCRQVEEQPPH
jgi:hypothetical protein